MDSVNFLSPPEREYALENIERLIERRFLSRLEAPYIGADDLTLVTWLAGQGDPEAKEILVWFYRRPTFTSE